MRLSLIVLGQYSGIALGSTLMLAGVLRNRLHPKRFYFIRHGQSLLNLQHIRQGSEGALSPKGRAQAERTGSYLAQYPIERIYSSPYERARETANIVERFIHAPITYTPLFAERRNPSEVVGRSYDDPIVVHISEIMDRTYHDDSFRYSDEENFLDIRARAAECLKMLERQPAHEACVITHRFFIKMLISYLLYRENLHSTDYVKLSFFNQSDNACITVCEYRPWHPFSPTKGWRVLAYNIRPPENVSTEKAPESCADPVPIPSGA